MRNLQAEKYLPHVGCEVQVVTYGLPGEPPVNVSIECVTHGEVLTDEDVQIDAPQGQYFHCSADEYVGQLSFCPTCDMELTPIPDDEIDPSIFDYVS